MVDIQIFPFLPDPNFKFGSVQSVDWSNPNLSESLRKQINNNHAHLRNFQAQCRKISSGHDLQESHEIQTLIKIQDQTYLQPYRVSTSQCLTFLERFPNYAEVETLDLEAIYQEDFNVQLYAIVVLSQGEYYGHIYSWVSPYDSRYCFFIGIRNRVDSIFLENTQKQIKGLSRHLIQGVQDFAQSQNCQKIVVVYPEPIMKQILPQMGFVPDTVPINLFGKSIQTLNTTLNLSCDSCLSREV